jgi:sugar lactone lactonase YvrE
MKYTLLILLASGIVACGQVQYAFTNFVGMPGGPGSADGTGSMARFNNPQGIAVDSAGNLYVADSYNATIRKITPAGVVTTLAGSAGQWGSADGSGSAARFGYGLTGIAVDNTGTVYLADRGNHTIRKITPDGVVTTLAGRAEDVDGDGYNDGGYADGNGGDALFNRPEGVAVDSTGNVYVADTANFVIRKITPDGLVTTLAGSPGQWGSKNGIGTAALFGGPYGVALDGSGNLYVIDADFNPNTIRKITPDGMVTTVAGSTAISGINYGGQGGMTVDSAGNIYVWDGWNRRLRKITPAGTATTLAGCTGCPGGNADGIGTAARFNGALGLAVDSAGNVYVADTGNSTIRKVTLAGVVTTVAGSSGYGSANGAGTAARFYGPTGVALDSAGNLYVADSSNDTIRKVTPDGAVTTLAGSVGQNGSANGTGSSARFWGPQGIAVDKTGNVYVADSSNETVRKITPTQVVTTLAGSPGQTGSDDGLGSAARFGARNEFGDPMSGPVGMAMDTAGNLYVSDLYNHTIRKITPDGEVTTLAGSAGEPGSADGIGFAAQFNLPSGVAVDSVGNVYVADYWNHEIRKITPDGTVTTLAGDASVTNPNGDPLGGYADGTGSAARFSYPRGLALDNIGNVLVADTGNNVLRRITPDGAVTTIGGTAGQRGGADGIGPAAQFDSPWGVAMDNAGNLFVTDYGNNRITKGTPVSLSPSPRLQIVRIARGVQLSWPVSTAGFTLEVTDALAPAPNWLPGSTAPVTLGDQNSVAITMGSGPSFFRLRKQ